MENRTKHYFQKYIARKLVGRKSYLKIKFLKLLFYAKIGKKYEISVLLDDVLKNGDIFFDVGANLGQYISRIIKKHGEKVKIIAFEPVLDNFKLLEKYFGRYESSLILENYAVSDTSGKDILYIPLIDSIVIDTQASLNYENRKKYYNNFIEQNIDKISIDDYILNNSISKVDFLKIDTEGNDELVISGAVKTIETFRPVLFCEDITKSFYEDNIINKNYSVYLLTDNDKLVTINQKYPNTLNDLYIFIPDEKKYIFEKFIFN